jgi:hypothetical protein
MAIVIIVIARSAKGTHLINERLLPTEFGDLFVATAYS